LIGLVFEIPLIALCASAELEYFTGRFQLAFQSTRIILLIFLMANALAIAFHVNWTSDEIHPFLPRSANTKTLAPSSYGTVASIDAGFQDEGDDEEGEEEDRFIKERQEQRLKEAGNWWTYFKGFSIFIPYLIPKKDRKVQLCMVINILCLLANRALNVLVPRQL